MKIALILLFAVSAARATSLDTGHCWLSFGAAAQISKEPQPLYLTNEAKPSFILPNSSNVVEVPAYDQIILGCSGKDNRLEHLTPNLRSSPALCLGGREFYVSFLKFDIHNARCRSTPEVSVEKSKNACLDDHASYDVGFDLQMVDRNQIYEKFASVLQICRDETTYRTYYSKTKLFTEIENRKISSSSDKAWKYEPFYPGYDMNSVYEVDSQLKSLETILGSAELARKYINSKQHLVRGQLTSESDLFYEAQQSATFWQLNAEPQWASINQGNWRTLENDVRTFAVKHRLDLDVYTGVHGIASLRDEPLYLHANGSSRAFPVPKFHWKVMHDPISSRATAFVVSNEPYTEAVNGDAFICTDIGGSRHFDWLTWDARDVGKGVAYVCTVEELREAVKSVPELNENGVL